MFCYTYIMKKLVEFLKKIGLLKASSDSYKGTNQTADPTIDL